jgi:peptidoglycan/LPS O-acetylase OafA/YrhL
VRRGELSRSGFTSWRSSTPAGDPLMGRRIAWVLSLAVLAVTGVLGIYNGLTEWRDGRTPMQHSVTVGVLLYGILGLITALGLFRRRRWSVGTAFSWGIAVTYVPGVAVTSYGGEGATMLSAIAASGATALIAAGVVWTAHLVTQRSSGIDGAVS